VKTEDRECKDSVHLIEFVRCFAVVLCVDFMSWFKIAFLQTSLIGY